MTEGAIRIVHQTSHLFPRPVEVGEIEVCLEPLGASFHQVVVTPIAAEESRWHDAFGNPRKRLLVRGPFERLEVTAVSTVPRRPDGAWRERFASLVSRDGLVAPSPRVPHLVATRDFAREVLVGATLRERLVSFVEALARSATFDTAATDVDTPLERFVATRRGVCQDF
ncbi:MAG: hypothetical protein KC731_43375, partial [Myxococcales bacterium]|nr:hypothetical protein [Myxococcales bacterium]